MPGRRTWAATPTATARATKAAVAARTVVEPESDGKPWECLIGVTTKPRKNLEG